MLPILSICFMPSGTLLFEIRLCAWVIGYWVSWFQGYYSSYDFGDIHHISSCGTVHVVWVRVLVSIAALSGQKKNREKSWLVRLVLLAMLFVLWLAFCCSFIRACILQLDWYKAWVQKRAEKWSSAVLSIKHLVANLVQSAETLVRIDRWERSLGGRVIDERLQPIYSEIVSLRLQEIQPHILRR